jgi:hypothetical protein
MEHFLCQYLVLLLILDGLQKASSFRMLVTKFRVQSFHVFSIFLYTDFGQDLLTIRK